MRMLIRAFRITVITVLIFGLAYPLVLVGLGQVFFPHQANGSLLVWRGQVRGSVLIAQPVTNLGLFMPRPSAVDYNAMNSGATNYGPTNPRLFAEVKHNLEKVLAENPGVRPAEVPTSMVESSGSGLDPDISVADATLQVPRVARRDHIAKAVLIRLIQEATTGRTLGIWGEPRVNVNRLNLFVLQYIAGRTHGISR